MSLLSRTCPCCMKPIAISKRLELIKSTDFYCPNCGVRLEAANISYWVNVCFSGAIIAALYGMFFRKSDLIFLLLLLLLGNPIQRLLDLFGSLKKID